jgi:FMN hydrolase / 5-amino-6-(5-phospho-D-ribitylamino)uracil phosphatase
LLPSNARWLGEIRGISLDLDDTLWPIGPAIVAAEQCMWDYFAAETPRVTTDFDHTRLRAVRDAVVAEHPRLLHDLGALRKLSIQRILTLAGYADPHQQHLNGAYAAFYAGRNRVCFYGDALPALARLHAHFPLISLTNGNADLAAVGIQHLFVDHLHAARLGAAKPAAITYHAAAERLGIAPQQLLHIGDHPEQDVAGAKRAGCRAIWLCREPALLEQSTLADAVCRDLHELTDLLSLPR